MSHRVVITGQAGVTPIGQDWERVKKNLIAGISGIKHQPEWTKIEGMKSFLAGEITDFEVPSHYARKKIRSAGRVALMSIVAAEKALAMAGLLSHPALKDGSTGISYGSGSGSPPAYQDFVSALLNHKIAGVTSTTYIKMMSHTTAANLGVFFETTGRIIPTNSACTSGSQGVGYAYESVKFGKQKAMIAGGAEELSVGINMVFDIMFAASTSTDVENNPRPFDVDRNGMIVSEGAATLILEEYEFAKARGAKILGEVVGFGCNSDGVHITQPSRAGMANVMKLALEDAGLPPEAIGYISAHGTATDIGDVTESLATNDVFGSKVPISGLKGYIGHSLGACGAIELWLTTEMLNDGWFAANKNLKNLDPRCAELNYITGDGLNLDTEYFMSNNFAFGGVNTSIIVKKFIE
ncbi:MAG: beta-ketoacyl-ACP synthase [SAR324 cluster bacterium]|nr:beta-ketoacyl-ACP synthase [SAR324 cluster bacterium]